MMVVSLGPTSLGGLEEIHSARFSDSYNRKISLTLRAVMKRVGSSIDKSSKHILMKAYNQYKL